MFPKGRCSFCGCAQQGEGDISAKPEDSRSWTGKVVGLGVSGNSPRTACVRGRGVDSRQREELGQRPVYLRNSKGTGLEPSITLTNYLCLPLLHQLIKNAH